MPDTGACRKRQMQVVPGYLVACPAQELLPNKSQALRSCFFQGFLQGFLPNFSILQNFGR